MNYMDFYSLFALLCFPSFYISYCATILTEIHHRFDLKTESYANKLS